MDTGVDTTVAWGLFPHKIQHPSTSLWHMDWLPHSSTPPGRDQAQLLGCQLSISSASLSQFPAQFYSVTASGTCN